MTARLIIADVFEALAQLDDGSIDLCITSPPFLALRSYLPSDHPDKHREIGSEPTPAAFIDTLLDVVEALTPKLAPHGSICFELGDTYSGSGGAGGDYSEGGLREGQPGFGGTAERQRDGNAAHWRQKNQQPDQWPLAKSLCLIPESFRWALVYGRNPFHEPPSAAEAMNYIDRLLEQGTEIGQALAIVRAWATSPEHQPRRTPRWRARNVIRWCRPNPSPGALGDKFRPGTSEMVVACKSAKRYFDLDATRDPNSRMDLGSVGPGRAYGMPGSTSDNNNEGRPIVPNPAGAPPLDWWEIPREDGDDVRELATENAALWAMLADAGILVEPDRFHPATSELIIACKSAKRYFDLDAVREPSVRGVFPADFRERQVTGSRVDDGKANTQPDWGGTTPPLDWWEIPTEPYKGSHYATFPKKLLDKPILAMCPQRVCVVCGEPSRRIVEQVSPRELRALGKASVQGRHTGGEFAAGGGSYDAAEYATLGWSDCGHGNWRRGLVLDPFCGSGTTLQVAVAHGRDAIGIDLDARNAELARERCGMFLEVIDQNGAATTTNH